jgi:SAM-dependent methyltransferase
MVADATPVGAFKALERDGWQARAGTYDERAGRLTQVAIARMLDRLDLARGARLLDVCCGPGYAAGAAAARGARATGIDIAPAMLAEARARFPGLDVRAGDAEVLGFADRTFDAVICAFGMLHLEAPKRAIEEAFRVLRPSGRYAFSVWSVPERALLLGLMLQAIPPLPISACRYRRPRPCSTTATRPSPARRSSVPAFKASRPRRCRSPMSAADPRTCSTGSSAALSG